MVLILLGNIAHSLEVVFISRNNWARYTNFSVACNVTATMVMKNCKVSISKADCIAPD